MTAVLDASHQTMISHSAVAGMQDLLCTWSRPSVLYRPAISIDGNQWCALYGANLQDGVAGFGDSPEQAMAAFDLAWTTKLGEQQ